MKSYVVTFVERAYLCIVVEAESPDAAILLAEDAYADNPLSAKPLTRRLHSFSARDTGSS